MTSFCCMCTLCGQSGHHTCAHHTWVYHVLPDMFLHCESGYYTMLYVYTTYNGEVLLYFDVGSSIVTDACWIHSRVHSDNWLWKHAVWMMSSLFLKPNLTATREGQPDMTGSIGDCRTRLQKPREPYRRWRAAKTMEQRGSVVIITTEKSIGNPRATPDPTAAVNQRWQEALRQQNNERQDYSK